MHFINSRLVYKFSQYFSVLSIMKYKIGDSFLKKLQKNNYNFITIHLNRYTTYLYLDIHSNTNTETIFDDFTGNLLFFLIITFMWNKRLWVNSWCFLNFTKFHIQKTENMPLLLYFLISENLCRVKIRLRHIIWYLRTLQQQIGGFKFELQVVLSVSTNLVNINIRCIKYWSLESRRYRVKLFK